MTTLYVICESGFEYNDEIYHRPESEGGVPVMASADIVKANEKCKEMNFKKFCNEFRDITRYFYNATEQFSPQAIELLKKNKVLKVDGAHRGRENLEWDEAMKWQDIPADDLMEIYAGCKLSWFEVYEVSKSV